MLAGTVPYRQQHKQTVRQKDLKQLADLLAGHLGKGDINRALQILGMAQYVYVPLYSHRWLLVLGGEEERCDIDSHGKRL